MARAKRMSKRQLSPGRARARARRRITVDFDDSRHLCCFCGDNGREWPASSHGDRFQGIRCEPTDNDTLTVSGTRWLPVDSLQTCVVNRDRCGHACIERRAVLGPPQIALQDEDDIGDDEHNSSWKPPLDLLMKLQIDGSLPVFTDIGSDNLKRVYRAEFHVDDELIEESFLYLRDDLSAITDDFLRLCMPCQSAAAHCRYLLPSWRRFW